MASQGTGASSSSGRAEFVRLSEDEKAHFKARGFVLVRKALAPSHIKAMHEEIKFLQKRYKQKDRDIEEEGCTLDPFFDMQIPERSKVRTSLDTYLGARRTVLTPQDFEGGCIDMTDAKAQLFETSNRSRVKLPLIEEERNVPHKQKRCRNSVEDVTRVKKKAREKELKNDVKLRTPSSLPTRRAHDFAPIFPL